MFHKIIFAFFNYDCGGAYSNIILIYRVLLKMNCRVTILYKYSTDLSSLSIQLCVM